MKSRRDVEGWRERPRGLESDNQRGLVEEQCEIWRAWLSWIIIRRKQKSKRFRRVRNCCKTAYTQVKVQRVCVRIRNRSCFQVRCEYQAIGARRNQVASSDTMSTCHMPAAWIRTERRGADWTRSSAVGEDYALYPKACLLPSSPIPTCFAASDHVNISKQT